MTLRDAWFVPESLAQLQALSAFDFGLFETAEHRQAQSAHSEGARAWIVSAVHEREIAMDVHPVIRQQGVDVGKRCARHTLRYHLRPAGMVGLDDVFQFTRP